MPRYKDTIKSSNDNNISSAGGRVLSVGLVLGMFFLGQSAPEDSILLSFVW
jgi:hypothetical protein